MRRIAVAFLGSGFGWRYFILIACGWPILLPIAAAQSGTPALPVPGQISEITCQSDRSQSYALYLPSTYTSAKRWPSVYFFDPGGRGRRPLELYKSIAEKYGWILAGSNNSRNFSAEQAASVNAIWLDTHLRFALDEQRIFASGFSGGARVAGAMALSCPQCHMAGIVAFGAGYPTNQRDSKDNLLYFFGVGDRDFNWPEVAMIRRQREDRGQPYRVRVFSGSHQWPPPDVMDDAIQWLTLKAMQQKLLPPDRTFIDDRFRQIQSELQSATKSGDSIAQLAAYRSLCSDFNGLKDVAEFTKDLATLKNSAELRKALKTEQQAIEQQYAIERDISPKLHAYVDGSAPDPSELRLSIVQAMSALKNRAEHSKDERNRLIYARAFEDMRVEGIENGQQELEAGHFAKAESCFELMSQISDDAWPFLLLAEAHAASGDSRRAMRALADAVRHGLKNAETLASDPRLQVLKSDPAFQKLLTDLKQP